MHTLNIVNYKEPIYNAIRKVFDVTEHQLKLHNRKRNYIDARKALCLILLHKDKNIKQEELGSFLNKARPTVSHMISSGKGLYQVNSEFRNKVIEAQHWYDTYLAQSVSGDIKTIEELEREIGIHLEAIYVIQNKIKEIKDGQIKREDTTRSI